MPDSRPLAPLPGSAAVVLYTSFVAPAHLQFAVALQTIVVERSAPLWSSLLVALHLPVSVDCTVFPPAAAVAEATSAKASTAPARACFIGRKVQRPGAESLR